MTGDPTHYSTHFNQSDCKNSGPSAIEEHCLLDMGLSAADAKDLTLAWRQTTAAVMRAVYEHGGWAWQMFTEAGPPALSSNASECAKAYRGACLETSKQQTHMCSFKLSLNNSHSPGSLTDPEGDVAKFLLLRGPFAYLGTGWVGCIGEGASRHSNETYVRPAAFERDYGTPLGICGEEGPNSGVFTREYTKAKVSHDCHTGESLIQMK
eukprot:SAG11_NODE_5990_length_1416_cov_1.322703_2_plen_209_part_00